MVNKYILKILISIALLPGSLQAASKYVLKSTRLNDQTVEGENPKHLTPTSENDKTALPPPPPYMKGVGAPGAPHQKETLPQLTKPVPEKTPPLRGHLIVIPR